MTSTKRVGPSDSSMENGQHFWPLDDYADAEYLAYGDAADIWKLPESAPPSPGDSMSGRRVEIHKVLRVGPLSHGFAVSGKKLHSDLWKHFLQTYHTKVHQWEKLRHKNLVRVLGLGKGLNLRVEFCGNGSVREYLKSQPAPYSQKLRIIIHTLDGLNYMHTQDPPVVHGNLNAGKLFIDEAGTTKIGEFGLAALCDPFAAFVPTVSLLGLSRWLSPEMLTTGGEVTPRPTISSDVWALGCTLYEIITENIPYSSCRSDIQIRRSIRLQQCPGEHGNQFKGSTFNHIWTLLNECWDANPRKRPSVSVITASVADAFQQSRDMTETRPAQSHKSGGNKSEELLLHGASLYKRFKESGTTQATNEAIEYWRSVLSETSNSNESRAAVLSNLGRAYCSRFDGLGELVDLNKAIECIAEAVLLTPDGHAVKPSALINLGNSYLTRFERLGEVADLNKAIECGADAVSLTPDGHAGKPGFLNNLGNSYRTRFERLGEAVDMNKAIECGAEAVLLTPNDHADRPTILNNLAVSYHIRFGRLGEVADLSKAIECIAEAVLLTPDGHAVKPRRLNNLGNSYQVRFERLGEVADLNKAIKCGADAVSLTSDGHTDKPDFLNNLGISYRTRFERLGEVADLNKAIDCGADAVSLTPDGHADKPAYLKSLGDSYRSQFSQTSELRDLDTAIAAYRDAALSPAGRPSTMLQACLSWARLASFTASYSPYPAYLRAMDLLPQFVWIENTLGRRYSLVEQLRDFATEAAAFAISIGNLELALEWLEAGRSIIWGQAAQLRTPFELLSSKDQELANRLKEVSSQLENSESRSSVASSSEVNATDLNIAASGHIQLALEWDTLLQEARSIAGFENFLKPPKFNLLLGAAKFNPIAIINVHESRCDALILQPNCSSISHVPLTELSVTGVMNACKNLVSQVRQRKVGHLDSIGSLERSLHDLWSSVLHPILEFLGYTPKLSMEKLPRLTWCTTGLLSFLPLHAAGCYDGTQDNAMDRVISSYTPTLSALLAQHSDTSHTPCGVLAVSQEHTPGLERLPGTKDELVMIKKYAHKDWYLQLENEEATVEQVLEAMDQFSWVHMACHGSQDTTDPTESAFHLHDGKLTLADISKKSFTNKGLAFLSACQTATGDETLPEEAVHLAAGMLMAGFPSVIGTMWSRSDEDGPKIADKVYASLLKDGRMDRTDAARALHEAVVELRAVVGERSFERWAPFIHIGC